MFDLKTPRFPATTGIYAPSWHVEKPTEEHVRIADELCAYIDNKELAAQWEKDHGKRAWALAHCQLVADDPKPLKAFVVAEELYETDAKKRKANTHFPARVIWNAEILKIPELVTRIVPKAQVTKGKEGANEITMVPTEEEVQNKMEVPEGCMSFMERDQKLVKRAWRVRVRYQYLHKGMLGLAWKTVEEDAEGLKAQIFQHEIQHFEARNIYHS